MFGYEPHAEAGAVHLRGAGGVAEAGRWIGHGAERLVFRAGEPRDAATLARPVHETTASESITVAHAIGKMYI